MKEISKNNLIKLYIDEASGGSENKLLVFQVNNCGEAGKVYLNIKSKVKRIRAAYFQYGLVNGISRRITETDAEFWNNKRLELEKVNKKINEFEKN
jgi:hypothetical protein